MTKSYTLQAIADITETEVIGDATCVIDSVATLQKAERNQISFITNEKYYQFLKTTKAGAIILPMSLADGDYTGLVSENPYFTFAQVAELFAPELSIPQGIHPSAIVHPSAEIAPTASIGPLCVIEQGVSIGENVIINPNCFIGQRTSIGKKTQVMSNVSIYHETQIGESVIIAAGSVIGSDGFGFAEHKGKWHKIPQLGRVIIHDQVEIGANVTIDRGTIEDTVIEQGVKIDNQVQVAHNVIIGAYTVIAGCVGIAGSAKIGKYCAVGGATAIGGHIEIADNVKLSGMSMVTKSIKQAGIYSSGTGIDENKNWRKNIVRFKQLDKIARKVTALERAYQHDLHKIT